MRSWAGDCLFFFLLSSWSVVEVAHASYCLFFIDGGEDCAGFSTIPSKRNADITEQKIFSLYFGFGRHRRVT